MNNEPQDIEELLKIILAVSEGIADAETIDKVRSLAGKLKENPDYNQVKALEYTIRTIFDKIYENHPAQKLNYKFGNPISIGDLTISTSSNENTPFPNNRVITVSYPTNLASILHASIDKPAWEYLHAYLNMKLISDTFNKKEFAKQLLKLKMDKNILPGSIIDLDLLKAYLPMEEEKKKENEPENIEELLKIILVVSEGISDAETIGNLRSFAEKLKENPEYNQIKALEHAVWTIFDKIYEKCPAPKTDSVEDPKVHTDSKPKSKIKKFILGGAAVILMLYSGYVTYLNIQEASASKSAIKTEEKNLMQRTDESWKEEGLYFYFYKSQGISANTSFRIESEEASHLLKAKIFVAIKNAYRNLIGNRALTGPEILQIIRLIDNENNERDLGIITIHEAVGALDKIKGAKNDEEIREVFPLKCNPPYFLNPGSKNKK